MKKFLMLAMFLTFSHNSWAGERIVDDLDLDSDQIISNAELDSYKAMELETDFRGPVSVLHRLDDAGNDRALNGMRRHFRIMF